VHITPEKFETGVLSLKRHQMFSVHSTPEKSESGVFTLKTRQMFFVHTKPEKLENVTINGHFGFVFEGNSVRENT